MFSVNMLKVLRLPSLKICTCLLSALFFYDIFFVFITPLFMKDGKSVMVEVRGREEREFKYLLFCFFKILKEEPGNLGLDPFSWRKSLGKIRNKSYLLVNRSLCA
jgi:hypothetical protein